MTEYKHMVSCFLCGRDFQFGPHRYAGQFVAAYQMSVCGNCYKANHDGWAPHYEARIIGHLQEKNLAIPKRQEDGYLPRNG